MNNPQTFSLKSEIKILIILLFIPFLLEATGIPQLIFEIPSFPLTVGRSSLVLLGLVSFCLVDSKYFKTPFSFLIYILCVGTFLGAYLGSGEIDEILKSILISSLYCSCITAAYFLNFKFIRNMIFIYFFFLAIFWTLYGFLAPGRFDLDIYSYGEAYRELVSVGDASLINYHGIGIYLSIAYLAIYEYISSKTRNKFLLYIPLTFGIYTLSFLGSRSNLIISLITIFLIFVFKSKTLQKSIEGFSLLFFFLIIVLAIISSDQSLASRFDLTNTSVLWAIDSRLTLISNSFAHLLEHPFGLGPSANTVEFYNINLQPHLQYLTYGLSCGILGFFASLSILLLILRIFTIKSSLRESNAFFISAAVLFLTYFTNDLSGALVFLNFIFIQHISIRIRYLKN